jgi:hypothetical protein
MKNLTFSVLIALVSASYFQYGQALLNQENTVAAAALDAPKPQPVRVIHQAGFEPPVLRPGADAYCHPCLSGAARAKQTAPAARRQLSGMEWRCGGCGAIYLGQDSHPHSK